MSHPASRFALQLCSCTDVMLRLFSFIFIVAYFEVVMIVLDRTPYAIALHQRMALLESQIAELGVLRNRVAQAQLRRCRSRRASEKPGSRRRRK